MGSKSLRVALSVFGLVAGLAAGVATPAIAAEPTLSTDAATGNVTVTLANGTAVVVPSSLVSEIAAAMNSGDAAAVKAAIKALVLANAANDDDLATAIYILAVNSTTDTVLQTAAYNGVVAGNPGAATEVAANQTTGNGTPAGGGEGGEGGDGGFPSGGTSGGGSTPSPNTP